MSYNLILVGLGNIGEKYRYTRHNIGWLLMEKISKKHNLSFETGKGDFYFAEKIIFGKKILFVLPTTYMNNSGKAIKQILKSSKNDTKDVCVFVDEYNFPIGKLHIKRTGSDGGHNGLDSVITELQTKEFMRLRLGIDKKFGPGELVDYVLSNFNDNEINEVDLMLENGLIAVEHLIKAGFERAMSDINSGNLFKDKQP
jgi:PTH1 family peptidyl-tRNA hydrolase